MASIDSLWPLAVGTRATPGIPRSTVTTGTLRTKTPGLATAARAISQPELTKNLPPAGRTVLSPMNRVTSASSLLLPSSQAPHWTTDLRPTCPLPQPEFSPISALTFAAPSAPPRGPSRSAAPGRSPVTRPPGTPA